MVICTREVTDVINFWLVADFLTDRISSVR